MSDRVTRRNATDTTVFCEYEPPPRKTRTSQKKKKDKTPPPPPEIPPEEAVEVPPTPAVASIPPANVEAPKPPPPPTQEPPQDTSARDDCSLSESEKKQSSQPEEGAAAATKKKKKRRELVLETPVAPSASPSLTKKSTVLRGQEVRKRLPRVDANSIGVDGKLTLKRLVRPTYNHLPVAISDYLPSAGNPENVKCQLHTYLVKKSVTGRVFMCETCGVALCHRCYKPFHTVKDLHKYKKNIEGLYAFCQEQSPPRQDSDDSDLE